MSEQPTIIVPTAEEARTELSGAALRNARANRPLYLLIVAAIAALGAGVYTLAEATALASASRDRASARDDYARVQGLVAQIKDLQQENASRNNAARFQENAGIVAEMAAKATEIGLTNPTLNDVAGDVLPQANLRQRRINCSLMQQPADLIMAWLKRVTMDYEGLEVFSLVLNPGSAGPDGEARWNVQVVFVRWERTTK